MRHKSSDALTYTGAIRIACVQQTIVVNRSSCLRADSVDAVGERPGCILDYETSRMMIRRNRETRIWNIRRSHWARASWTNGKQKNHDEHDGELFQCTDLGLNLLRELTVASLLYHMRLSMTESTTIQSESFYRFVIVSILLQWESTTMSSRNVFADRSCCCILQMAITIWRTWSRHGKALVARKFYTQRLLISLSSLSMYPCVHLYYCLPEPRQDVRD